MRESSDVTRIVDLEVEEFRRDGATVLRQLLPESWIDELAAGVEHNRTRPSEWSHWYTSPDESVGFWSDYVTWRDVPSYRAVVFESGLAQWPGVSLSGDAAFYLRQGQPVLVPRAPTEGWVRLYEGESRFIGMGEILDDGRVAPRRLMSLP